MSEQVILLVTRNKHKVTEITDMLAASGLKEVRMTSLDEVGCQGEIKEEGETFRENALSKVLYVMRWLYGDGAEQLETIGKSDRAWLLADDSGLEVDALGGRPGVYSARYASGEGDHGSENSSSEANNEKLLHELSEIPPSHRTARFRTVLALTPISPLADPGDLLEQTEFFDGTCEGRIQFEPRGEGGFGYDPLFVPDGYAQSFAELGEFIKNKISHRSRALAKLTRYLKENR